MAAYELTGTVKAIMDVVKFESGFTKREFVVTTDGDRYPQHIKFECVKDRCALLDGIKAGQRVTVTFDVRGNEYKGRYFVSLSAWKVNPEQPPAAADESEDGPPVESMVPPEEEDLTKLPF
jgi:single-strand DNA-binding protein